MLTNLLMNLVDNPVNAIVNANYIGILAWAIIFGVALKKAGPGTKKALEISPTPYPSLYSGSSAALPSVSWA